MSEERVFTMYKNKKKHERLKLCDSCVDLNNDIKEIVSDGLRYKIVIDYLFNVY